MSGRDRNQARDPEDWFADVGSVRSPRPRRSVPAARADDSQQTAAEDWLDAGDRGSAPRGRVTGLGARRLAAAAAALLLCLLIGLAAGGVFSGGSQRRATPPRTTPTTRHATISTPTAGQTSGPTSTLKPGDTGAQVRALQRALASLGYSTGRVDGRYGTATQRAVTRFQRTSGLAADGILGPNTLRALDTALKRG